jgi:hypothetical protein
LVKSIGKSIGNSIVGNSIGKRWKNTAQDEPTPTADPIFAMHCMVRPRKGRNSSELACMMMPLAAGMKES